MSSVPPALPRPRSAYAKLNELRCPNDSDLERGPKAYIAMSMHHEHTQSLKQQLASLSTA